MGPEIKFKKRKVFSPSDQAAQSKKQVKQVGVHVTSKKRKAAEEPDSTTSKKPKIPNLGPPEGNHSEPPKGSYPTQARDPTFSGTLFALDNPISSGNFKAAKVKMVAEEQRIKLNSQKSKPVKRDLTKSVPLNYGENQSTTDESVEEEIDDQTEALLKGFESDGDGEKDPEDQGYEVGDDIPKVEKKFRKKAQKAAEKSSVSGIPGVVYIGRIPHGFYEQEMRQYFSQFGNITNLRLSRNRQTGKSKHFAFVQFESAEVAEIVSKTMDNYLLFGHILKCKLVAPEQVHKDLWIGANKRFKIVPWNKIQGRQLSQTMVAPGWDLRTAKEEKRRSEKKAAMKLMDYDFESPKLKSAKELLEESQPALVMPVGDQSESESDIDEQKTIEAPEKSERQAMTTNTKEHKKQKTGTYSPSKSTNGVVEVAEVAEVAEILPAISANPSKKKKKNKKRSKSSDQPVSKEEPKAPISGNGAHVGSAVKTEPFKKSKKNKSSVVSV